MLQTQRSPLLKHALVALLVVFALGTGCASAARQSFSARIAKTSPESVRLSDAEDLERRGKFLESGLAYAQLAGRTIAPEKQEYQLKAAEVWLRGNYTAQAQQVLGDVNTQGLDVGYTERKLLLLAQVDLARGRPERALSALDSLERAAVLTTTRVTLYTLKAQIHAQSGNPVEAARARAKLDGLLSDPVARRNNQNALLQHLVDAPEAALLKSKPAVPDAFAGWIDLALIVKSSRNQPGELSRLLQSWKTRYPNHAAGHEIENRVTGGSTGTTWQVPQRVALLLPQQGNFAKAAEAVRDGFLAAHYLRQNENFRPDIRIYDTGATAADISGVYQRAVREGAQVVVGPLDKTAVSVLARQGDLPVPTLALNYAEPGELNDNLYQFALSPEDEAAQTAERAWLDGHDRCVALVPEGAFGERLLSAFRERWTQLGGELIGAQTYALKDNDLSAPIKKLLAIDQSEQRRTELRTALGIDIKYSPRRRDDVDFVFVGANPRHARLIRPQLNFHQASAIPMYGTSHVFSGVVNARIDHDMDNVTFGDMPWVLPKARRNTALNATISQLWPQLAESYMRLFAFGIDAYNLIPNMNQLTEVRTVQFPGETGSLYLSDDGRIQRRLTWAEFKNGTPRLSE